MKATQNQLYFIKKIENCVSEKFVGSTKKEASDYISRNIDEFNQISELNGLSTWQASKGYL